MSARATNDPKLDVLFEDNHLLVVNKPAPLATMGAESGATAHSLAAAYIKHKYNKPGKAFVGIVSRLDSMTTGVLVMARTSKAASRLSAQFADRSESGVSKIYLAAVKGSLEKPTGELVDFVRKDDEARRMRVVEPNADRAQEARLRYVVLGANEDTTLVAVQLLTGRKHQIRVQFADHGHAILGDRKYNSQESFPCGVALHSWRLQIVHPTLREKMWFDATLPKSWKGLRNITPTSSQMDQIVQDTFGIDTFHPLSDS